MRKLRKLSAGIPEQVILEGLGAFRVFCLLPDCKFLLEPAFRLRCRFGGSHDALPAFAFQVFLESPLFEGREFFPLPACRFFLGKPRFAKGLFLPAPAFGFLLRPLLFNRCECLPLPACRFFLGELRLAQGLLLPAFALNLFGRALRILQRQFYIAFSLGLFRDPLLFQCSQFLLPLSLRLLGGKLRLAQGFFLFSLALRRFLGESFIKQCLLLLALPLYIFLHNDCKGPWRNKPEVLLQRRAFPGNLRTFGFQPHTEAHALEHILNLGLGHLDLAKQVFRVQAIRTFPVTGHIARAGGIGEQGALGRIHLAQTLLLDAFEVAKGIVAAGIEDDDIHRIGRLGDAREQNIDFHALILNIRNGVDVRIHRHHVVAPGELNAVARVVEKAHALCRGQSGGVGLNGGRHVAAAGVHPERDVKPGGLERRSHCPRVVGRIGERCPLVIAVAHDQSDLGQLQQLHRPFGLRPHPGIGHRKKQCCGGEAAFEELPF